MAEDTKKTAKKPVDKNVKQTKKADNRAESKKDNKPAKNNAKSGDNKKPNSGKKQGSNEKFFEYKGKPLVRSKNDIFYGDINEAYVVHLNVKSEKEVNGEKIADDVQVELISTDETLPPKERIIKKSEKKGLFTALDLGDAWLSRQLKKEKNQ